MIAALAAEAANVADWIAAVGQALGALFTAAAVGVAVWLGWRDRKWRRADQQALAAEQADQVVQLARLLTVELTYDFDAWSTEIFVIIRNTGALPMHDVRVTNLENELTSGLGWRYYDDGDPRRPMWATVIPPGEKFKTQVEFTDDEGKVTEPGGPDSITIDYTDSSGRRWRRTDNNLPERVPPERVAVPAAQAPSPSAAAPGRRRLRLRKPWTLT